MIALVTQSEPLIGHAPHTTITPLRIGFYVRLRSWWSQGRPFAEYWGRAWTIGMDTTLVTWHFGLGPFVLRVGVPTEVEARAWSATRHA